MRRNDDPPALAVLEALDPQLPPGCQIHSIGEDIQDRLTQHDPIRPRQPDAFHIQKMNRHLFNLGERLHQRPKLFDQAADIHHLPIRTLEKAFRFGVGQRRPASTSGDRFVFRAILFPQNLRYLLKRPRLFPEELGFPDRQLIHGFHRIKPFDIAQFHDPVGTPVRGLRRHGRIGSDGMNSLEEHPADFLAAEKRIGNVPC